MSLTEQTNKEPESAKIRRDNEPEPQMIANDDKEIVVPSVCEPKLALTKVVGFDLNVSSRFAGLSLNVPMVDTDSLPAVETRNDFDIKKALRVERRMYEPHELRTVSTNVENLLSKLSAKVSENSYLSLPEKIKLAYQTLRNENFTFYDSDGLKGCHLNSSFLPDSPNYKTLDGAGASFLILELAKRQGWSDVGIVNIPGHAFVHAQGSNLDFGNINIKDNAYYREKYHLPDAWEPKPIYDGKQILANSHFAYANAAREDGDLVAAIQRYAKAVRINPSYVDAYKHRGLAKHCLNKLDGALADFNVALEIDPSRYDILNCRGVVLSAQEKYYDAVKDFNAALGIKKDDPETFYNRGVACLGLKNYRQAWDDFMQCLSIVGEKANPKLQELAEEMLPYAQLCMQPPTMIVPKS
ncbi:MAG: tetratricopeptide repeat protein [Deltaproteobacteria bacterium]|nr:tetratricopeptide repeat protein [Deltaproteobacteria bacterium]